MEKEYYKTVVKITAEEIALLLKNINFSSFKDEDVISYTIDKKDLSYHIILKDDNNPLCMRDFLIKDLKKYKDDPLDIFIDRFKIEDNQILLCFSEAEFSRDRTKWITFGQVKRYLEKTEFDKDRIALVYNLQTRMLDYISDTHKVVDCIKITEKQPLFKLKTSNIDFRIPEESIINNILLQKYKGVILNNE